VAHIVAEEEVTENHGSIGPARPRGIGCLEPMRVREAMTEKKPPAKQPPYEPRKPQTRARMREGALTRHSDETIQPHTTPILMKKKKHWI